MLQDRFPQLMRDAYGLRVLVAANYTARQSLSAKGITPAIFLSQFYERKNIQLEVVYNYKEKGIKPLCGIVPIDFEEYGYKEQLISQRLRQCVSSVKMKMPREVTPEMLQNRADIESHFNNINFHWFESANRIFLHAQSVEDDNWKVSTLEQPFGLALLLQTNNKSCRQNYEKMRKDIDQRLVKIFQMNPSKLRALPVLVIILHDAEKSNSDSSNYIEILRQQFFLDPSLMCRIQINGKEAEHLTCWSNYSRPILNIEYKIGPSDTIRIIGQDGAEKLNEVVYSHKCKIKTIFENRLDMLLKRYEERKTAKNRFLDFFKGSSPTEKYYVEEEAETREIADCLFLLEDYKQAYELYRVVAGKMTGRERRIEHDISEMVQQCLALGKYQGVRIKQDHYGTIKNYAEQLLKNSHAIGKNKLIKYLMFLIYMFHGFRMFEKATIRVMFYYYLKLALSSNEDKQVYQPLLATLIYEQFANINLLYTVSDYRRYCYDLIRVGSKFSEFKLPHHNMRCLQITSNIYQNTFPIIQKYVNMQLSRAYLQDSQFEECLNHLKKAWINVVEVSVCQSSLKGETDDSEYNKMLSNHQRILVQIEKHSPETLSDYGKLTIPILAVCNAHIELPDETVSNDDRTGEKWEEIGDVFLESAQLISKKLIKSNLIRGLRYFDAITPEEKELTCRVKLQCSVDAGNVNMPFNMAIIKRNSRTCFVNQPIRISFDLWNKQGSTVEVSNIDIHFKGDQHFQRPDNQVQSQSYRIISRNPGAEQQSIKGFQSKNIQFVVVPTRAGMLQLSHISWMLMRVSCCHRIKQPHEMLTYLRSMFYKLNVVQPSARLVVTINHSAGFFEGQFAEVEMVFRNEGKDMVDNIYMATSNKALFKFDMKRFDFTVAAREEARIVLPIHIPLVPENIKSGKWRYVSKIIFLYRSTAEIFRTARVVIVFTVNKIVDVRGLACERLSKNLHMLTFSIHEAQKGYEKMLKSLHIRAGLDIKKVETAQFSDNIKYYIFARNNPDKTMEVYEFDRNQHKHNPQALETLNGLPREDGLIALAYVWRKEQQSGVICPKGVQITFSDNYATKARLPFSFKIKIKDQVSCDFSRCSYCEVDARISIKNIFSEKEITLTVQLLRDQQNDVCWQGLSERKVCLVPEAETNFKVKVLVFRPGVFDLGQLIKYVISNRGNNSELRHSEYENVYLVVKNNEGVSTKTKLLTHDLI